MLNELMPQSVSGDRRFYGVVVGVVTNNEDPKGMGRVKVKFPWLSGTGESNWARVASPMAGKERGFYFLPEVEDEVLVMFEHGYVECPYVVGALWNGQDKPPESNGDKKNNKRLIKSRSGHLITLDDTQDAEKISIVDKSGKNRIELDTQSNKVTIVSEKDLSIEARGDIRLATDSGDLSIKCRSFSVDAQQGYQLKGAQASMEASDGMAIKCMAGVDINGGALEVK
ncbi:phage baseplate assembly protein V [Pyxidicoccus sp. 3LG]